jgi:ornithine cyclodeaminase/alanine dehydrogenase-like protein (mu-crystallin family)
LTWFVGPRDLARLFETGAVTPRDCIDAVEASFREQGEDNVGVLPRAILTADGAPASPRSRALKLSASYMRGSRLMGASVYSTHFRPGDVDMWLAVFSGDTGRMLGVLCGKALSVWKTGATAAVATRHLARDDAAIAAIVGTGRYALAQLRCLAAVRTLREVRCFSRDAGNREAFVREAREWLPGLRIDGCASPRDALRDADVVTTITVSPTPVVLGEWLAPGSHCNAMGQHAPATRELDTGAIVQADVFVDAREQALAEKGEIMIPIAEGALTRDHVRGELGEVVAGRIAGRTSREQRTMFCSGGTALEYMTLCAMLVGKARDAGIGQPLDDGGNDA